jgi:hypothetical protein
MYCLDWCNKHSVKGPPVSEVVSGCLVGVFGGGNLTHGLFVISCVEAVSRYGQRQGTMVIYNCRGLATQDD